MPRNLRKALNRQNTLSRNTLPTRDRALGDIEMSGQPGDQPLLGADQMDADEGTIHAPDISASDTELQAKIIAPADVVTGENNPGNDDVSGMDVAQIIQRARTRKGWRQTDLARIMKVKQSAISQWESGKFLPDIENRIKLAAALELSPDDLMPELFDDANETRRLRLILEDLKTLDLSQQRAIALIVRKLRESKAHEE